MKTASKTALITGVTGQDGAYLAKLLLERGYRVIGGTRRSSSRSIWRLDELGIADKVELVGLEMLELSNLQRLVSLYRPHEIYNLAAQSFVATSFEQPLYSSDVDAMGVLRLLEAIRAVDPAIRFYQASTSEMFGLAAQTPQRESTPFHPRSPYAFAKVFAHHATANYREAYGLHAMSGILFNHESPLRGLEFVTRKISAGLAHWKNGERQTLRLGNLSAARDWGFAGDYVAAIHAVMQAAQPRDYVVATGVTHTVREFAAAAAQCLGIALRWSGEGAGETAVDAASGQTVIAVDEKFYRPAEVQSLQGDASLIARELGWRPTTGFAALVEMMARADYDRLRRGVPLL